MKSTTDTETTTAARNGAPAPVARPATSDAGAPRTVAQSVRAAIDDGRALLEASRDDDRLQFDGAHWHRTEHGRCRVCAAGAMMEHRFVIRTDDPVPTDFPVAWARVFRAIDWVRLGSYGVAWHVLYRHDTAHGETRSTAFRCAVEAELAGKAPVKHRRFHNRAEYTEFLDGLEQIVLPAIEKVEATIGPEAWSASVEQVSA